MGLESRGAPPTHPVRPHATDEGAGLESLLRRRGVHEGRIERIGRRHEARRDAARVVIVEGRYLPCLVGKDRSVGQEQRAQLLGGLEAEHPERRATVGSLHCRAKRSSLTGPAASRVPRSTHS